MINLSISNSPAPVKPLTEYITEYLAEASDRIRQEAWADARSSSSDAISAALEAFQFIVEDDQADHVEKYLATIRLKEYGKEAKRRQRVVSRAGSGVEDPKREAWEELRRAVLADADTPRILIEAGIPMRRTGTSRGRFEWHGPCPICGCGDDRLCAWSGPNGRLWCRQCHWSGDAISAASLIAGPHYRDCVRWLATFLNGEEVARAQ